MSHRVLNQIVVGATAGDAITDHALTIRGWLRSWGFTSNIYGQHIHESMAKEVRSFASYRPKRGESLVIFHHSIGDPLVAKVAKLKPQLLVIYHNITPPEYFAGIDPAWVQRAKLGIAQLQTLQPHTQLALGVSAYNTQQLTENHFAQTNVLPIPLDSTLYDGVQATTLAQELEDYPAPQLLFVGRFSPNKRQEDLVKLLYYVRQLHPQARLILVGNRWVMKYDVFLQQLAQELGIADGLVITGHVSHEQMVTYFRHCDLYVSMSEHEGFGKPLIESMYVGLPVLAYASSAVPATMGNAGILFHDKNYPALAELVDMIYQDKAWRERIIAQQKQRASTFLAQTVQQQLQSILQDINYI